MTRSAFALAVSVICAVVLAATAAAAQAQADTAQARVTAASVALRSGPGAGFRTLRVAQRGEVFPVRERSSVGYWLKVRLPDATLAWLPGDSVYVFELGEANPRPTWEDGAFAPPPLQAAHGEVAIVFGALGSAGFMAVRPTWLVAPSFGLEATGGAAVSAAGRTFVGGLGAVVNLFAHSPVVPFVVGGGGFAYATPNSDSFVLDSGASSMLFVGGGLRLCFKHRLTLRVESRGVVLFTANRSVAEQEVSGGLTVFF